MRITDDWNKSLGEVEDCREQIHDLIRHYGELLGLDDWDITLNIYSNEADTDCASCDAKPEYRRASVELNLASIPPSLLESVVRHELIHALTWSLFHIANELANTDAEKEWVRIESERLTENLTTMPLWNEVDGPDAEDSPDDLSIPTVFPGVPDHQPSVAADLNLDEPANAKTGTVYIPTVVGNAETTAPEAGEFSGG